MKINDIFDFVIIITSCFPLYLSLKFIFQQLLSSSIILYPVFFVFFSLQSLFNIFMGKPEYPSKFYNLSVAYDSELVSLIYFLTILILNIFFFVTINYSKKIQLTIVDKQYTVIRAILYLLSFSGIILVLFSPDPSIYISYGEVRKYIGESTYLYHGLVAQFTLISAVSVIAIRISYAGKIPSVYNIILIVILLLDMYLNAKRLVFIFLPVYFFVEYFFSTLNQKPKYKILLSCLCFVFLYSYYSVNVKHLDRTLSSQESYLYQRLEFGRDDILKFVINKKLVEGKDIVEYPGQTVIGAFAIYLPREFVVSFYDKPYPYGQYLTSSLVYNELGAGLHGWTMTTSIIDEFIANFGWFGLFLLLVFYYKFFKYTDNLSSNEQGFRLLLYFLIVFLHIVHTAPYAPILYIALFYLFKRFFGSKHV